MAEQSKTVTFDLDWQGDRYQDFETGLMLVRRDGRVMFGFMGGMGVLLTPDQAESTAANLLAASVAARSGDGRHGRRNPHCSNCGDERGGPVGHEISECTFRRGGEPDA
ncbi:hypothetical protein ACTOB_001377 [Actinoplanes oblitus]|uniref:Uncharacterized protein n=1 Tax=Actinoplanes oblitus TaxID=3040509 RepID=A0ABY8WJL2_9ACTN|nr:hypothetical protein [Actinoplanes oblitus]WIM97823.1 hypothetical protein ACTOB_001377 [Actinoplanes oblitus]